MIAAKTLVRRVALIVVAAVASVFAAAAPAAASGGSWPGGRHEDGNNRCHFNEWGGVFICGSESTWVKPDGWPQVFVVAPNKNVYTKWASDDGTYNWLNMGGLCRGDPGVAVHSHLNEWAMSITCQSSVDDVVYHRSRAANGRWDPTWIRGAGSF